MRQMLDYVAEAEPWNVYRLEDGTTVRVKCVLTRVVFTGFDDAGKPQYELGFQQIVDVEPGEHTRDKQGEPR